MAKKAPTNGKRPRKTLGEKIADEKRKLRELQMQKLIEDCDNPREAKALIKAAKILRDMAEAELSEQVSAVVTEMLGFDGDDEEDDE